MTDQANVYVKNNLTVAIQATRYCLPDHNMDLDISITNGNQEMVYLVKDDTYLIVKLPTGKDTSDCLFAVSNEELLSWETMTDRWKVQIKENDLLPESPTTVNVDIGEDE